MSKLSAEQIESFSVTAVTDTIQETDTMRANILVGDKGQTWDGYVNIFNKKSCRVEDFLGRIAVQVKGKQYKDLSKSKIKYPVRKKDLNNFQKDKGAIFFVVYIKSKTERKIYYCAFTPVKINEILKGIGEQKTKTIEFNALPEDPMNVVDIMRNFYRDSHDQCSFKPDEYYTKEELSNLPDGGKINFTLSAHGTRNNIISNMLKQEIYLYVQSDKAKIPVGELPKDYALSFQPDIKICIDNNEYYSSFTATYTAESCVCEIGRCFKYICREDGKTDIKISLDGDIRSVVYDLSFCIHLLENNGFCVGNDFVEIKFSDIDYIQNLKSIRYSLNKVVELFDSLHVTTPLPIKSVNDANLALLEDLHDCILLKKQISISRFKDLNATDAVSFRRVSVANITLLLVFLKNKTDGNMCYVFDYFTPKCITVLTDDKHKDSVFTTLTVEDYATVSNIDFASMVDSYQDAMENHPDCIINANWVVLRMLQAYDNEVARKDLLDYAEKLALWIKSNSCLQKIPAEYGELNLLQIYKRRGSLNKGQEDYLLELLESTDDSLVKFASHVLLENKRHADFVFVRMSDKHKEQIQNTPINSLYLKLKS